MPYNPFEQAIGQPLSSSDLQQLVARKVAEGYYVEYKRELPSNEKIGHSIASFANTYGGWYIVGVTTDAYNIAINVVGFDSSTCPDPIAKVREIAKTHISPVPIFFPRVITLSSGRLALIVYIPDEQDTPFISRNGRIYRRAHDASDPIPEADRYALDRLYERGREAHRHFERFCQDARTLSNDDAALGWVSLFLWPYPDDLVQVPMLGTPAWLEELLLRSQRPIRLGDVTDEQFTGNLPFNSAQLTSESVILRQIAPTQVGRASLTLELFGNGAAKFHIPLRTCLLPSLQEWARSPQARQTVLKLIYDTQGDESDALYRLRFFDLGGLWRSFITLLSFYQEWLGDQLLVPEFRLALLVQGAWRASPFVDTDSWADHVQRFGLPVLQSNTVRDPTSIGLTIPVRNVTHETRLALWTNVITELTLVLGFPLDFFQRSVAQALASELPH